MRVLVAVPVRHGMLFHRALDSVFSLEWDSRLDIMHQVGGDDHPLYWNNLLKKLNEARGWALDGDYDALLTIDSDIIVPADALRRLVAVDADVVYGLIVLRRSPGRPWNVSTSLEEGKMIFLSHDREAARAAWGKVIPSAGHGQAICLIRRPVLERLEFRTPQPIHYAQDWYLSIDCQREGFVEKHDLGVVCGHIDTNPLRIYWPDPDAENLYREERLE